MHTVVIAVDLARRRVAVVCDDGSHAAFEITADNNDVAVGDEIHGKLGSEGDQVLVNMRSHDALNVRVRLAGCSRTRAVDWALG